MLCGYESTDITDIENTFKRIERLFRYGHIPFIMKYQGSSCVPWKNSEFAGLYSALARWCNQVQFVKKRSFRSYCCEVDQKGTKIKCASVVALEYVERNYPEIARRWFDMKFTEVRKL